jgi:hypothetical protein
MEKVYSINGEGHFCLDLAFSRITSRVKPAFLFSYIHRYGTYQFDSKVIWLR